MSRALGKEFGTQLNEFETRLYYTTALPSKSNVASHPQVADSLRQQQRGSLHSELVGKSTGNEQSCSGFLAENISNKLK